MLGVLIALPENADGFLRVRCESITTGLLDAMRLAGAEVKTAEFESEGGK
jgi:hypothetical protein